MAAGVATLWRGRAADILSAAPRPEPCGGRGTRPDDVLAHGGARTPTANLWGSDGGRNGVCRSARHCRLADQAQRTRRRFSKLRAASTAALHAAARRSACGRRRRAAGASNKIGSARGAAAAPLSGARRGGGGPAAGADRRPSGSVPGRVACVPARRGRAAWWRREPREAPALGGSCSVQEPCSAWPPFVSEGDAADFHYLLPHATF